MHQVHVSTSRKFVFYKQISFWSEIIIFCWYIVLNWNSNNSTKTTFHSNKGKNYTHNTIRKNKPKSIPESIKNDRSSMCRNEIHYSTLEWCFCRNSLSSGANARFFLLADKLVRVGKYGRCSCKIGNEKEKTTISVRYL